jgi:hypothetical protein
MFFRFFQIIIAVLSVSFSAEALNLELKPGSAPNELRWIKPEKFAGRFNSINFYIKNYSFNPGGQNEIRIQINKSGSSNSIFYNMERDYQEEFLVIPINADREKDSVNLRQVKSIDFFIPETSNFEFSCSEININKKSSCLKEAVQVSRAKAAKKIGKAKNGVIFGVHVVGSGTNFPVYKAKVSYVTFSGNIKGETDADGEFEAEVPANSELAVSITAQGYELTTTKAYKPKSDKTVTIKLKRDKSEEPLATPTPEFHPTTRPTSGPNITPTNGPNITPTNRPNSTPARATPTSTPAAQAPTIKYSLSDFVSPVGGTILYLVQANGTGPFKYQWFRNGNSIPGGNGQNLSYSVTADDDGAQITATVYNDYGSATTNPSAITIGSWPSATISPSSAKVMEGLTIGLTVKASGTSPFTYQWRKGSTLIEGATSDKYTFKVSMADDGAVYSCIVGNKFNKVSSNGFTLTVTPFNM